MNSMRRLEYIRRVKCAQMYGVSRVLLHSHWCCIIGWHSGEGSKLPALG